MTLPAGTLPKFPYQYTLNGSGGVNSALQNSQGLKPSGSPWSGYVNASGMIDLVIKIKERMEEEMKKPADARRDAGMYNKMRQLVELRNSCLRGLLLDKL